MNRNIHVRCGAGEKRETTSNFYLLLLDCVLWESLAKNVSEYTNKGDLIGVHGRLQTNTYQKEEIKKKITEVVAEKVTFLHSKERLEKQN